MPHSCGRLRQARWYRVRQYWEGSCRRKAGEYPGGGALDGSAPQTTPTTSLPPDHTHSTKLPSLPAWRDVERGWRGTERGGGMEVGEEGWMETGTEI